MVGWFHQIKHLLHGLGWLGAIALSLVLAVGSFAFAAVMMVQWSSDHFKGADARPFMSHRHPVIRGVAIALKNLAGYFVILLGIIMALPGVPGQGFLVILIGLTLINFPGKRKIELRIVHMKSVLRVVNAVRGRFGRPVLELD